MEKKVLLFSGGFDSMLQEWLIKPDVLLYVDMKTSYSAREVEALQKLPRRYRDRLVVKELPLGEYERENKYLPYRNLMLATIAMQYGQHVYLGFNAEDDAPDKDYKFLYRLNYMFDHLNENCMADMNWDTPEFSFEAPFRKLSKTDMVKKCLEEGMPVSLIQNIRTCYDGKSEKGCGVCGPCIHKAVALINNDIYDPKLFDEPITAEYLESRVEYGKENKGYYKAKYLFDLAKAAKKLRKLQE